MTSIFKSLVYILLLTFCCIAKATIFEHQYVESPYLHITEGDSELVLKSTNVNAQITGIIADVNIVQTYINTGDTAVEAKYIFPASPSAAVYGLTLNVNGRITKAIIKEKEQAKQEYEKAKTEGKSASLLVQTGPNIFSMNVANILPGDQIKIVLNYVEKLSTVDGLYTFNYPASIGPRYGDFTDSSQGIFPAKSTLNYNISIDSAGDIFDIESVNHQIKVNQLSNSKRITSSDNTNKHKAFVLRYNLRGSSFNEGVIVSEGDENHFLLMVQPPKTPNLKSILPREYIFIVDVSGSMSGMPTETSKNLMAELLYVLEPHDKFNIIQFAGGSEALSPESLDATEANLDRAFTFIEKPIGSGGTNILPALKSAMKTPNTEGYSRSIIVMTDGLVSVSQQSFDLLRQNLNKANLFSFGVANHEDYGIDQSIIEQLANIGQTDPIIITSDKHVEEMVNMFRDYVSQPLLSNISIDFGDLQPYDLISPTFPDIFTERPLIVSGKWKGNLDGIIKISGDTPNGRVSKEITLKNTHNSKANSLKYLWAKDKLQLLNNYNNAQGETNLKAEITELGLKYNLLTKYTSFVAVDDVVRNPSTQVKTQYQNPYASGSGFDESAVIIPLEKINLTPIQDDFQQVSDTWFENKTLSQTIDKELTLSLEEAQCFLSEKPELEQFFSINSSIVFEYKALIFRLNLLDNNVAASKSCEDILSI